MTIDDKAFATLQAEFALRGHVLNRTASANGSWSYYSSRWGMARHLDDIDAVQRFLQQLGGPQVAEVDKHAAA